MFIIDNKCHELFYSSLEVEECCAFASSCIHSVKCKVDFCEAQARVRQGMARDGS